MNGKNSNKINAITVRKIQYQNLKQMRKLMLMWEWVHFQFQQIVVVLFQSGKFHSEERRQRIHTLSVHH